MHLPVHQIFQRNNNKVMHFFSANPRAAGRRHRTLLKLLVTMKLSIFFILIATLQASAVTYGQNINGSYRNASLTKVMDDIYRQTGKDLLYGGEFVKAAKPVTATLRNVPLAEALKVLSNDQPFEFVLKENVIFLAWKVGMDSAGKGSKNNGLREIAGTVRSTDGKVIANASIQVKGSNIATLSDEQGNFRILVPEGVVIIVVSCISYESREFTVDGKESVLPIMLNYKITELKTIIVKINSGFSEENIERVNGAYSVIDSKTLDYRVSTDFASRINGNASGIIFNPSAVAPNIGATIRGQSTVSPFVSKEPLVILDNFPFDGDLRNINPNDIETITILKDAAAASIWGARSGNGVIVLTSKRGRYNQKAMVNFNSNFTFAGRPNLNYDTKYIDGKAYFEIEKVLFDNGYYNNDLSNRIFFPAVSPGVELLNDIKTGKVTQADGQKAIDELTSNSYRDDYKKYLLRNSFNQQYSVNVRGGSQNVAYYFSVGYDKNDESRIGNDRGRITLSSSTSYAPTKKIEVISTLEYSQTNSDENNSLSWMNLPSIYGRPYTYATLKDKDGNSSVVNTGHRSFFNDSLASRGYLDWKYRPLDDLNLNQNTSKITGLILKIGSKYKVLSWLSLDVLYQNQKQTTDSRRLQGPDSYAVRDLVNSFTQYDNATKSFKYNFPKGSILSLSNGDLVSNNLRIQATVNKDYKDHHLNFIAAAEAKETKVESFSRVSYGYNEQYGTAAGSVDYVTAFPVTGGTTGFITPSPTNLIGSTQRFISYLANGLYSFKERYSIMASARRDGANIFGVETNKKFSPFWSIAPGWEMSKEPFYKVKWLPYLKARTTLGYNGNIYNGTAFLIANFGTVSSLTNLPYGIITSPPNSELRWEKVRNINVGFDFRTAEERIMGSIDLFQKDGSDLIQEITIPPTSGFTSYRGNAAKTRSLGYEAKITSNNFRGKFSWQSTLLFTYTKEKVVSLNVNQTTLDVASSMYGALVEGRAITGLYSYRMARIDPQNGDPIGFVGKSESKDYTTIVNRTPIDSLVYHGPTRPPYYGNLRNTFSFKGFCLTANLAFRLNYYYRRPTVDLNYQNLLNSSNGIHQDYLLRWTQPGDEVTGVPSIQYQTNANRSNLYKYSQSLVERADHIRLQDITFSYDFSQRFLSRMSLRSMSLYFYASNLGLLWKKSSYPYDPDFTKPYEIPNPKTFSFGLRVSF